MYISALLFLSLDLLNWPDNLHNFNYAYVELNYVTGNLQYSQLISKCG